MVLGLVVTGGMIAAALLAYLGGNLGGKVISSEYEKSRHAKDLGEADKVRASLEKKAATARSADAMLLDKISTKNKRLKRDAPEDAMLSAAMQRMGQNSNESLMPLLAGSPPQPMSLPHVGDALGI